MLRNEIKKYCTVGIVAGLFLTFLFGFWGFITAVFLFGCFMHGVFKQIRIYERKIGRKADWDSDDPFGFNEKEND